MMTETSSDITRMRDIDHLYPKGVLSQSLRLELGVLIGLTIMLVALIFEVFTIEIAGFGIALFFASVFLGSLLGALVGVVSMKWVTCLFFSILFSLLATGSFTYGAMAYEESKLPFDTMCGMPILAIFFGTLMFGTPIALLSSIGFTSWVMLRHENRWFAIDRNAKS